MSYVGHAQPPLHIFQAKKEVLRVQVTQNYVPRVTHVIAQDANDPFFKVLTACMLLSIETPCGTSNQP